MTMIGNLQARILIDAGTTAGPVQVGTFEIPITVTTEQRDGNKVGLRVELPEDAVKAALQQWAAELASSLA